MTQYELESRWVTAEGISGVSYRFSELVRIKSGEYSGQTAEVIARLSLEPQPIYGVTLPPNEEVRSATSKRTRTYRVNGRTNA